MQFIENPTRFLFFTGKGGVGKTSLACATAIALADHGNRVLLVSTDPASNLDQVLGVPLSSKPVGIPAVDSLFALNIDPDKAAKDYRERAIGPFRGVLPDPAVAQMEEQLSGACTVEIAAFDEFTELLTEPETIGGFDHILFDTAPTGHTLRLLQLPASWTGFLDTNTSGTSCLGPATGLKRQRDRYATAVATLSRADQTTLILVARPDTSAMFEAARTSQELRTLGLANQHLVVNGLFTATDRTDLLAVGLEECGRQAILAMPPALQELPCDFIPLKGYNIVGVDALRDFLLKEDETALVRMTSAWLPAPDAPTLSDLIDDIVPAGHGLVMVMGKGGVGKTTVAAAIAVELAGRGFPVHLTTTDPAAHVAATLEAEVDGLRVSRIDPAIETQAYKEHVLATAGKDLDSEGRALLEEDLRSPCTEEVAVFHAFSRMVALARKQFVVMDTAPTGHTLLLLDATGAYHKEVLRTMNQATGKVTTPMMRLQDPEYTKILIVTLPETTPVLEALELQEDLRRAKIDPYAWVINNSLAAAGPTDPVLVRRAQAEMEQIEKVKRELAKHTVLVPRMADEPVGADLLRRLVSANGYSNPVEAAR